MKSFSDIVAGEDWRSQEMINDGEEQMMIMGDETLTNIQKGSKKLNDVIVAEMETMVRDREKKKMKNNVFPVDTHTDESTRSFLFLFFFLFYSPLPPSSSLFLSLYLSLSLSLTHTKQHDPRPHTAIVLNFTLDSEYQSTVCHVW